MITLDIEVDLTAEGLCALDEMGEHWGRSKSELAILGWTLLMQARLCHTEGTPIECTLPDGTVVRISALK
ncbi:MAG: hypothetical protein AAB463_01440 [Patescibacteria group bacterium]